MIERPRVQDHFVRLLLKDEGFGVPRCRGAVDDHLGTTGRSTARHCLPGRRQWLIGWLAGEARRMRLRGKPVDPKNACSSPPTTKEGFTSSTIAENSARGSFEGTGFGVAPTSKPRMWSHRIRCHSAARW